MSKKFRLLMVLVLITGLFGGLLTGSTVSADPTPGTFIEIPRIDVDDVFGTGVWETQIQIQNLGADATVYVDFYGGAYEDCPPNEDGVMDEAEMWLPSGGVWTLHNAIPAGARSAFVTSDSVLAVTVDRWGPDPFGEFELSSSYTGIADDGRMVGPGPPYEYFAPYVMHGYNDLDTVITIQNSGEICASIWIYYKQEGNCEFMKAQHVEQIAPGEAIRIGPGEDMEFPSPEIDAPWLGSAYVTANVPLAIVVDQLSITGANRATLLTMRGFPYKQEWELNWYADLLYREISGWSSSIQVQNLTQDSLPTFVTVEFFDQSGDSILFVGDWICRNGANTFYLPAIIDLGVNFPFGYVGAAEIQSHGQVDYPGEWHNGEPIFAVVDIKKTKVYDESIPGWRHTVKGETQAGAYNAHPEIQKTNAWGWAMPYIAKEQNGVTSRIALRNNANCNKIKGSIYIYDETGRIVTAIPVPWLHPKHMKIVDLAYFGQIARGFVGAAQFWVEDVEQLCDTDHDGITDQLPVMPSIVVLNYGFATELPIGSGAGPLTSLGDLTRVYEAFPIYYTAEICEGSLFGDVTVRQEDDYYHFDFVEGVAVSEVTFEAAPFTVSGRAYVGPYCSGSDRLAGAYVELQVETCQAGADDECDADFDDAWVWEEDDDTTTSSAGAFAFADALKLAAGNNDLVAPDDNDCVSPACWEDGDERAYRLKIFVEEPGNTVSYISGEFDDSGHWSSDFHVDTTGAGGELDLSTGEWCAPEYTAPAVASRVLGDTTDSTGGYQIRPVDEGAHSMEFAKTGFFAGLAKATVECGKETQLNYELICSNPLTVSVVDTDANPIPGVDISVEATFAVNYGTGTDTDTREGTTNNAGVAVFDVAGATVGTGLGLVADLIVTGHDTIVATDVDAAPNFAGVNNDCGDTLSVTLEMCKNATVVGTVEIGEQSAAGYTVKALRMSDLVVVDEDVTTANGVYAVENLSVALGPWYRLQLYSPSGTLIGSTASFDVTGECGSTLSRDYDDGWITP